jgi:hypothetical protein
MAEWDWPKYREKPTRYMRKEVVLLNAEQYDEGFPKDKNARDFIKWLEGMIDQAPPEYRDSVYIELDSESGYEGSHYASIKIAYRRPETDAEFAANIADYERVQAEKDRHDKAEFERLKSKYPQRS